MGAVAHGECQVCGSRAPIDMAAHIAELEAALATIHEKTHRVTFHEEKILGGIRYAPGVYALMRIADIDDEAKLVF